MKGKIAIAIFLVVIMLLSGISIAATGTNQANNNINKNTENINARATQKQASSPQSPALTTPPIWALTGSYFNFTLSIPNGTGVYQKEFINVSIILVVQSNQTIELGGIEGNATYRVDVPNEYQSWNGFFPAVNSSELAQLNAGIIPSELTGKNIIIETGIAYKTPMGTFKTDHIYNSTYSAYVDSHSGVILNLSIPSGQGSYEVYFTLTATNVPLVSPSYSVTFTETGLPSGTKWSVTLNGTTISSTSSTISFTDPNGEYSFAIGSVSGYKSLPSNGTISVNGANTGETVTFSAVKAPSPSGISPIELYAIIGAVIAAIAIGGIIAIIRRKK